MRKTTKLAGTKDMAKITQMDTSTSTDVVILRAEGEEDCDLGQLLLGEVERVIGGSDAELGGVLVGLQTRAQDAVVHHVEERADAVPAFVVEPDLETERQAPAFDLERAFAIGSTEQGGIRYAVAGYSQVGESVIQLVEELDEGSVFSRLIGQDISDLMAEVLHQASLVDMLEYQLSYLLGLLAVGHGAGGIPAGLKRYVVVSLDEGQVVARAQLGLEEQRGAHAAQLAVGDDGDAVAQDVGLVHVVSGQDDGAAWRGTEGHGQFTNYRMA
ncbi:hypothetical protein EYF80_025416 [Liparis tanakae]|uniref:Uncharacterized protein n=1 Tax=Liparis tanakae TaxID=230148 RepID=A0A4Z2HGK7_9TELE|nr:hypothetical protein EYF80_025416 [Liparis tanakae]